MQNNTHSAIILTNTGKPLAFIDGIPDSCEHDSNGEELFFNNEGEYFPASASPNRELNDGRDLHEFFIIHKINGGCSSCSKCGKPFTPDFFAMP